MAKKATAAKTVEKATNKAATTKNATALMTTSILGDHLAEKFEIPKSHGKVFVVEIFDLVVGTLEKGGKVRIAGLGVFQIKKEGCPKSAQPEHWRRNQGQNRKASRVHDRAGFKGRSVRLWQSN